MAHRITIESLPPEHYERIEKVISSEDARTLTMWIYSEHGVITKEDRVITLPAEEGKL